MEQLTRHLQELLPRLITLWQGESFYTISVAVMLVAIVAIGKSAMQFGTHLHFTVSGWYPEHYHTDKGYVDETYIDLSAYGASLLLATYNRQSALWIIAALLGLIFHTGYMAGMTYFPNWFHNHITHLDRGQRMKFRGWWGVMQRLGAGTDTAAHMIGLSMSLLYVFKHRSPIYIVLAISAASWGLAAYRCKFWPRTPTTK